jgi:hypothetical protein
MIVTPTELGIMFSILAIWILVKGHDDQDK